MPHIINVYLTTTSPLSHWLLLYTYTLVLYIYIKAVLDNPAQFHSPFSFEITFECLLPLEEDLEWKVLYVGSAEDTTHDQVLDEILLGPIPVGINKFILQADAPDISQIPNEDILGVTVVLVTCSYREKEFVRVGYYVNNEYDDECVMMMERQ